MAAAGIDPRRFPAIAGTDAGIARREDGICNIRPIYSPHLRDLNGEGQLLNK